MSELLDSHMHTTEEMLKIAVDAIKLRDYQLATIKAEYDKLKAYLKEVEEQPAITSMTFIQSDGVRITVPFVQPLYAHKPVPYRNEPVSCEITPAMEKAWDESAEGNTNGETGLGNQVSSVFYEMLQIAKEEDHG